ncbi:MAG: RNA polymerase sigma factor [Roseivirga sp.]|nr:RNA polymerase sigma factor [Roseivirga sp.]
MEDRDILHQFKSDNGKSRAFSALVQKYQQRMYWHIRKMVIDHEDADDVLQEVFVKVYKNLEGFREASQLYTWIYRIATNEALTHLNKKKKRQALAYEDVNQELANNLVSGSYISGDEIQLKLQKALLTLPDKQRLVFNMKYFDDLKYDEISEITGTSVGALKASYHLAVKKIEQYLCNN